MKIFTDERCTGYAARNHPERPARISRTLEVLRQPHDLTLEWGAPDPVDDAVLRRGHTAEHIAAVRAAAGDFDADTPAHPGIGDHALRAVGGALAAMRHARRGGPAFSLLRPPGHHATPDRAMGFCYFNSIALAVLTGQAEGAKRVAVYDFDVHHGNGTEDILLDRANTAFFSIHQSPCYPGTGMAHRGKNCFNHPVKPQLPREAYRQVLAKAIADLRAFQPDLIGVSAGFDAYARDPLAQMTLLPEDYHWLGESLAALKIPMFSVLEGGYSDDLPQLVLAYLRGVAGRPATP